MADDEKGLLAGLGRLLDGLGQATTKLGDVIDKLWNAYGRFADLMKDIEKDNLAGRANQLLNQAQTILTQSEKSIADLDVTVQTLKRFPDEVKKDTEERKRILKAFGSEIKNRAARGFRKLMQ